MEQLTYGGKQENKEMFLARFAAHRAADEVIQGTGFDNGRGCFIGCTMNKYSHESFGESVAPRWIGFLADKIFEGLPKSEAAQFGTDLLAAIPVGINYKSIDSLRHELSILRLERLFPNVKNGKVADSIKLVVAAHKKYLNGEKVDWAAVKELAWAVRRAASAYTSDAYAASYAAASSCDACDAAASYAAYASADVRRNHWQFERDNLLRLVASVK